MVENPKFANLLMMIGNCKYACAGMIRKFAFILEGRLGHRPEIAIDYAVDLEGKGVEGGHDMIDDSTVRLLICFVKFAPCK